MAQKQGLIFIISGPSGSGKTTLRDALLKDARLLKKGLKKPISFTTRPRRTGERNKQDYIFISYARFKREQKAKKLLEWTKYLGYYYATPKEYIEEQIQQARSVILCLDLKGALKIKALYPSKTVTIFVFPPSLSELRNRIESRCRASRKEIQQRVELAQTELKSADKCDYRLINSNIVQAAKALKKIIVKELNKHNME